MPTTKRKESELDESVVPEFYLVIKHLHQTIKKEIAVSHKEVNKMMRKQLSEILKKIPNLIYSSFEQQMYDAINQEYYKYFNTGKGKKLITKALNEIGEKFTNRLITNMKQTAGMHVEETNKKD